jgi:NAD/NADP transhydrogenase beta subunit
MDLNAVEVVVLAGWALGMVAAVYAVRDDTSPLRRIGVPLLAALLPVVGTLVGLVLGILQLARTRSEATDTGAA